MVFGLRGVEFTLPCKADAEDEVGGGWDALVWRGW